MVAAEVAVPAAGAACEVARSDLLVSEPPLRISTCPPSLLLYLACVADAAAAGVAGCPWLG